MYRAVLAIALTIVATSTLAGGDVRVSGWSPTDGGHVAAVRAPAAIRDDDRVPRPGMLALLGLGLVAVGLARHPGRRS